MSKFEEIDIAIINDFRSVGCTIPEEIVSFNPKIFVSDILAKVIFRSLKSIDPDNDYPRALSSSRAQKVHQATLIVKSLQNMGYMDTLSYHCILYPNEGDTRKILMFLQERLPEPQERKHVTDFRTFIDKSIDHELERYNEGTAFWTPDFIGQSRDYYDKKNFRTNLLFTPFSSIYRNTDKSRENNYVNNYIPLVSKQTDNVKNMFSSLLENNLREYITNVSWEDEWNSHGLETGLETNAYKQKKQQNILSEMASHIRANMTSDEGGKKSANFDELFSSFQTQDADNQYLRELKFRKEQETVHEVTEVDIETKRQREIETAERQLSELESKIRTNEAEVQMFLTEILQKKGQFKKLLEEIELLEMQYQEKEQTIQLLDNPEENAARLGDIIDKRKNQIKSVGAKWEERRRSLIDAYREAKSRFSNREENITKKLEEIKKIRAEIKALQDLIAEKEAQFKELTVVYKKLPDESRDTYTGKIMELVKNVKKQSAEIKRILSETKSLQKEINTLTDRLNRTFGIVEDMIFQDAEKDKSAAAAYKLLASINSEYQRITDKIGETGNATNASLGLEDKIEKLQERIGTLDIATLEKDYQEIMEENETYHKLLTKT
jgi:hypothetical protein